MNGRRVWLSVLLLAALLLLMLAPLHINLYWLRILSTAFMFATLAQAINLIAGFTGYPAFGNVVFFGLAPTARRSSWSRRAAVSHWPSSSPC